MSNKITEISKRPYDGKFVLWSLTSAPDCVSLIDEDGSLYTPKLWTIMEIFENEKSAQEYKRNLG